jgi:hypothetical protein
MRWLAIVLCLAGCSLSKTLGAASGDDMPGEAGTTTQPEAGMEPDAPTMPNCESFSTVVNTCAVGAMGPALSVTGSRRYDTNTHIFSDELGNNASTPMFFETTIDGAQMTLLVVNGFTINGASTLRITGSRGFGVVSMGAITIAGLLDGRGGAGGRTMSDCQGSAGANGANNNQATGGASGGGGGGYGAAGGRGGVGDNNGAQLMGGAPGAIDPLLSLFGGCPGGRGGNQGGGGQGGNGGGGGAAIFLVSATSITVTGGGGAINAGGNGGRLGNGVDGGGGGGGSGGVILLESTIMTISGQLAANGGGGGGGAGDSSGGDGTAGVTSPDPAPGGGASGGGSAGGQGGERDQKAGVQPGNANGGAGGGGGGVGYISLICAAPAITGTISPARTPWP